MKGPALLVFPNPLTLCLVQAGSGSLSPLPAEPPIQGAFWILVVPALLLVGSALATWGLYRRFARREGPRP